MAQKVDLFSILTAYSHKHNSPIIDIDTFLAFLGKYAIRQAPEHPEWQKWTKEVPVKFWSELSPLVDSKKCEVRNNGGKQGGKVYLVSWYTDRIEHAYRSSDATGDQPFPTEKTLKVNFPPDQIRVISVGESLLSVMANPQEGDPPIIRLAFPEEFGTALTLVSMIPQRILESALLKVRNYFRNHGGRDYAMHKLPPQVTDREILLKDMLNQIQHRPLDCIKALSDAEDYSNLFWACFCSLIKNDVRREKERGPEDIAGIQGAYLIELFNSHYKSLAVKERERELALKQLETQLNKQPFLFTLDNIIRFTNARGTPLLEQYSQVELENYLKNKTTEIVNNELPDLLIIAGPFGEKWFIKKKNVLPLIAKLLEEAKVQVRKAVERRWLRMLTDYHKEPAMERDRDFEKLLAAYTVELSPAFSCILKDLKIPALYREMELAEASPEELPSIIVHGEIRSFSELYEANRRKILHDTKLLLPFWYSFPALIAVISFFTNIGKKNIKVPAKEQEAANEKEPATEFHAASREIEAAIVPEEYNTLDDYLVELEGRWSQILDKEARNKLVEDVKVLIRDHFRYSLRSLKNVRPSKGYLSHMAATIISATSVLKNIRDQKTLHTYIVAYLTQLLLGVKF